MEEQTTTPQIINPVPEAVNQSDETFEDKEIRRLTLENQTKQEAFDKKREINRLRMERGQIESREKEMNKRFNPKFNFTKEKAKFWLIASVVAITVAIVVVNIAKRIL